MFSEFEHKIVAKVTSAAPPLQYDQFYQFVRTLPWLALVNVGLAVLLGGWLRGAYLLVSTLISAPGLVVGLVLSPFFFFTFIPPLIWAASFVPLRNRRRIGWRLFVLGTILALIGAILALSVFGILFGGAVLYFTVLIYEEFYRR